MKCGTLWCGLLVACIASSFVSTTAQARPHVKRRILEEGERRGPPKLKKHRDRGSKHKCKQTRRLMDSEERRLESYQADLTGVDGEVRELERRLRELRDRKTELKTMVGTQKRRVESLRESYERSCERSEQCEEYDALADALERQAAPHEEEAGRVRDEIGSTQREMSALRSKVDGLRSEYASKRCAKLVPGETEQRTIDRCSAIFSDWNRLQAQLNRANDRLPDLRRRYERLLAQLDGIERRASQYERYLDKHCKKSKRVVKLRGYKGVRERARKLGSELDALVEQVSKLRGVKITVTPR